MPVLPVRGRNGSERAGSGPRGHVRTGAGKGRAPYRCIPIRKMEAVLARPGQSGTRVPRSKSGYTHVTSCIFYYTVVHCARDSAIYLAHIIPFQAVVC